MRKIWSVLLIITLMTLVLYQAPAKGISASISVDEDEYQISVDPSDDDQGYLEIYGQVEGSQFTILDQLTVTLSVNVTEEHDGEPTGRFWAASAVFDDETVTPEEARLTYNRDSADFTIFISPELEGQGEGDIAVPPGISPLTEGNLVLTMAYTGSSDGDDVQRMTIIPEYYHLINLSTPLTPIEVEAGNRLNYTLRIKNAGNEIDSVTLEIPVLYELGEEGWTTSIDLTDIDDMEPGDEVRATLLMQAPVEIIADRDLEVLIRVFTNAIDPDTQEPESSNELTIILQLKRSKVEEPVIPDDDDDDEEPMVATDSPYAIIGVTAAMAVIALIVIIILFTKRGGGDEGDNSEDMHSSMVRI
ncbi:MAG: hypothetical protein JXA22_03805 [Candidatus Thermoplasmatota archaeon]|nr:hypothetical protein [Candidatus Thermoplasmatota archaeon]